MNKKGQQSGFSKVEIFTIVAILGIVTAVATPILINNSPSIHSDAEKGITEAMADLSIAYSEACIQKGGGEEEPTIGEIMTAAGWVSGSPVTFGEVIVTPTIIDQTVSLKAKSLGASGKTQTKTWRTPIQ